jgi:CheY-like chemotaxis protein
LQQVFHIVVENHMHDPFEPIRDRFGRIDYIELPLESVRHFADSSTPNATVENFFRDSSGWLPYNPDPPRPKEMYMRTSPWKVALVEDTADTLEIIEEVLLRTGGYSVRSYLDPEKAVADLLAGSYCPDVLLLDHRMPGMLGTDVLLALHKNGRRFPTILMSAGPVTTVPALQLVTLGVEALLPKPFELVKLTAALSDVTRAIESGAVVAPGATVPFVGKTHLQHVHRDEPHGAVLRDALLDPGADRIRDGDSGIFDHRSIRKDGGAEAHVLHLEGDALFDDQNRARHHR